jgi:hypothetical protein
LTDAEDERKNASRKSFSKMSMNRGSFAEEADLMQQKKEEEMRTKQELEDKIRDL